MEKRDESISKDSQDLPLLVFAVFPVPVAFGASMSKVRGFVGWAWRRVADR